MKLSWGQLTATWLGCTQGFRGPRCSEGGLWVRGRRGGGCGLGLSLTPRPGPSLPQLKWGGIFRSGSRSLLRPAVFQKESQRGLVIEEL